MAPRVRWTCYDPRNYRKRVALHFSTIIEQARLERVKRKAIQMGFFNKKGFFNTDNSLHGTRTRNTTPVVHTPEEFEAFNTVMAQLPKGIFIRVIQPRQAGNHFAVSRDRYAFKEYYGKTIAGAIQKMIQNTPELSSRIPMWPVSLMSNESETTLDD